MKRSLLFISCIGLCGCLFGTGAANAADLVEERAILSRLFPGQGGGAKGEGVAGPTASQRAFNADEVKPWTAEQRKALEDTFGCGEAGVFACDQAWDTTPAAPMPVASQPKPEHGWAGPKAKVGGRYAEIVNQAAQTYGLDANVIHAVIDAESRYNPLAVSPKGAKGLMQLMDPLSMSFNIDPFDPKSNIEIGSYYLSQQMARFGSLDLALAAYNAGPGAVQKFGGIPPYKETQNYVRRIFSQLGLQK